ncbi:MAG: hypothetical protein AAB325_02440 [Pseudomonadota bacterium]
MQTGTEEFVRWLEEEEGSRFEFKEAKSWASRFASRLTGESGTGANSPFEVVSSLIGSRVPAGSTGVLTRESIGLAAA